MSGREALERTITLLRQVSRDDPDRARCEKVCAIIKVLMPPVRSRPDPQRPA